MSATMLMRLLVTRRLLASIAVGMVMSGCDRRQTAAGPPLDAISVDAIAVPLSPESPALQDVGDFHYAGGLALSTSQVDRLHGLSDLHVDPSGQFVAIGDEGALFEGRLVLDDSRRLIGVTDTRLRALSDEEGKPLLTKATADAEGLAMFGDGRFLVSFERRHRIWLYPSRDGTPQPATVPDTSFDENGGMEALCGLPDVAPDAYAVGKEVTGETWTCRLSERQCLAGPVVELPPDFALVAMTSLPGGRMTYLLRAFDEKNKNRNILRIVDGDRVLGMLTLEAPFTVDNFEGLAAVPAEAGAARFYLLSDDNASAQQRTLLLAFDWRQR